MPRVAVLATTSLLALGFACGRASAHAGLRLPAPVAGATLGDTPTAVQLTFWETPEASLSVIRVFDTSGAAYQIGRPAPVPGSPLSLATRVRPLPRGVYTVSWRVFSAVDGHATTGAYSFGVLVAPTGAAAAREGPAVAPFEMPARWILIAGLIALFGAACASVARFGGARDLTLGAGAWLLALTGLVLLAEAQRRNADASLAALAKTSVGRALIGRAVAIGAAGGALMVAGWGRPRVRRVAMAAVAVAAAAAMAVHVAAGHAASGSSPAATVGVQWAHFAAAGLWLGGLAALLLGLRGAPSMAKATAVRRFSSVAVVGLVVVAATGAARAVNELSSWGDLLSTGYGGAVSAKIALTLAIAALGAFNRWRSVAVAATHLRPLLLAGSAEVLLAMGALAAAAWLGTLPPPAALRRSEPPGLSASGVDFGTTVRVRLIAASAEPGPNRFVVHAVDYDSGATIHGKLSLRFTPLDDPGIGSTSLPLAPDLGDSYVGSGANLAFDGRWRVAVRIERGGDSVDVPLDIEARGLAQFISIERIPGRAPKYTVSVRGGDLRISPDPERAGRSEVYVTFFDVLGEPWDMEQVVVTSAAGKGSTRQQPVRRLEAGRFVADVELRPGRNTIGAVARASDGTRVRAAVDLNIPGGGDADGNDVGR